VIVAQSACKNPCRLRIADPLAHAFGVAEGGEPFEEEDEALTLPPVTLAKGVARLLAARFGTVVRGGGFTDGKHQVAQRMESFALV
jgi:hypothetical protein